MPQTHDVSAPSRDVFRLWTYGLAIAAICAMFSWRYPLIGNTQHLVDIGIHYCGRYGDWGYMWTDESFISGERAATSALARCQ